MTRRERLERKVERRQEWAEKAEARSDQHYKTGHRMLDAIPMGQPILIGHHSEKRDRNYRNRAFGHMGKFVEQRDLAQHHESKAAGLQAQIDTSIYSDDSDALEALEARIKEREAEREKIKLVNKLYRKGDVAALQAIGVDYEALKKKLAEAGAYRGSAPHLPYELSNLGGRIAADKKRLEQVKTRQQRAAAAGASATGVALEKCNGGYCRVIFAEKPERAVLDALKAAGFWWSGGSWAGKEESIPELVRGMLPAPAMA